MHSPSYIVCPASAAQVYTKSTVATDIQNGAWLFTAQEESGRHLWLGNIIQSGTPYAEVLSLQDQVSVTSDVKPLPLRSV